MKNKEVKALMAEKKPSAVGTAKSLSSNNNSSSTINSNTKSLVNQEKEESYMDFTEEDPVEPDCPAEVKGKYWCFVLYPESAPANWQEILNKSGLAWAMSPLHEHDLNADGSKKKAHYHVIIIWKATTTYNAVKKFTHGTLNATVPQLLHSPLGYYRYFTHKDNPEKYQYSENEILSGNGFDIADYAKMTKQQKLEMHMSISQMILDNKITSYAEAVMMCMSLGFDEYEMITTHTIHFTNLCKSVTFAMNKDNGKD